MKITWGWYHYNMDLKAWRKQYSKNRRDLDRREGRCQSCRRVPALSGKSCCENCLIDKRVGSYGRTGEKREIFKWMTKRQKGLCAICKKFMQRVHLDHDHKTGALRGLLCSKCNVGIGLFDDDISIMNSAVEYLAQS
jgi:Recombination endonuclease VII